MVYFGFKRVVVQLQDGGLFGLTSATFCFRFVVAIWKT